MSGTMGVKTILHPVTDLAKAKAIYTALLGIEPQADALAGALDQAIRIRQECATGKLQVDPARMRDEREQQVAHPHAPPEREQPVAGVVLHDDVA